MAQPLIEVPMASAKSYTSRPNSNHSHQKREGHVSHMYTRVQYARTPYTHDLLVLGVGVCRLNEFATAPLRQNPWLLACLEVSTDEQFFRPKSCWTRGIRSGKKGAFFSFSRNFQSINLRVSLPPKSMSKANKEQQFRVELHRYQQGVYINMPECQEECQKKSGAVGPTPAVRVAEIVRFLYATSTGASD